MHSLQILWNYIATHAEPIMGKDWFANSISLVGGVLGAISFLMQLPKRIKPIVLSTGDIEFGTIEHSIAGDTRLALESVKLSVVFSNSRNAFGVIEDVFIRVYTSDSFTPEPVIYFPTQKTVDTKSDIFSPIVLNPNSSASMLLTFGLLESGRSSKYIDIKKNYIVDVFYKLRGKSRVLRIPSIHTYNPGTIIDNKLHLKNVSQQVLRDKYTPNIDPITQTHYKGILGYVLIKITHWVKRYTIYIPKNAIFGFFETIAHSIYASISNAIAFTVKRPIIIGFAKKLKTIHCSSGDPKKRPITIRDFDKVIHYIDSATKKINQSIPKSDHLRFTFKSGKGTLERNGQKIIIYPPGDTSIYAHDTESETSLTLKFELRSNHWGLPYWTYNNKLITPFNMALLILNYFGLSSIHK